MLPMTRICSECTHAFCFTCSPNEYCSQAGCQRVLCSDCSQGTMYWCSDCERTFCNEHHGDSGCRECDRCVGRRCGCSENPTCKRCEKKKG